VLRDAQRLRDQGDERPGLLREIAAVYAARGDSERAYDWLERAIDVGWRLERLHPTPLFEPLRGEERFQELMERIDADVRRMKVRVEREGWGCRFLHRRAKWSGRLRAAQVRAQRPTIALVRPDVAVDRLVTDPEPPMGCPRRGM